MSLQEQSDEFRANVEGMLGEKFGVLARGIESVRASGIAGHAPKVGEKAPEFTLPDAYGTEVSLTSLLKTGPVVLIFYRGEWCPFCNLELNAFQKVMPKIEAAGATLVAVSPEKPDFGQLATEKNKLTFPVLSDFGNAVARTYSLVYTLDPDNKAMSLDVFKNDIGARNADGSWELPIPGTFVIDRQGVIRFAHADPDFMIGRAEPEAVLAVLETISA